MSKESVLAMVHTSFSREAADVQEFCCQQSPAHVHTHVIMFPPVVAYIQLHRFEQTPPADCSITRSNMLLDAPI